jgi:hypothetical protein
MYSTAASMCRSCGYAASWKSIPVPRVIRTERGGGYVFALRVERQ